MPKPAKRAHEFIDLTGDDESETRQKRPAPNGPGQHQSQNHPGQSGTSVYGGGHSSQNAPSSTAEPDYLDLTQDDEGPPLELYGTFRTPHTSHIATQVI
jgi:SWI/SNF-related matrix-associated actin-dependent regulator of chromatin subfamily A3